MKTRRAAGLIILFLLVPGALSQHGNDSLLFTIRLSNDPNSLFWCGPRENVGASLSGPVLMKNNMLLFMSVNGYALYNHRGKMLEAYSVIKENRSLGPDSPARLRVGYPGDENCVLTFREQPFEIYKKTLLRKQMKLMDPERAQQYKDIVNSHRFNLACNTITNDLAVRSYRSPHLIGYDGRKDETRWWSLDVLYSFTSPVIIERDGRYVSFFPGFRPPPIRKIPTHRINPIGAFCADSTWYFYGYANDASEWGTHYQTVYLCNQFGDLMYENSLVGKEVADAVLEAGEKVIYTVESTARRAFVPAIDESGDMYYGTIDYVQRMIEVKKRVCFGYRQFESKGSTLPNELFGKEEDLAFVPISIGENLADSVQAVLPDMRIAVAGKERRKATERDLRKSGYLVTIHRTYREDVKRKIEKRCAALPPRVDQIRDSLARISTSWFPYGIAVDHYEKGEVIRYEYGPGDVIVSARILNVTNTAEVFVRVDLEWRAEILVFSTNGDFTGRLAFNRQFHKDRGDMVLVSNAREILEKDYEDGESGHKIYEWKLVPLSQDR